MKNDECPYKGQFIIIDVDSPEVYKKYIEYSISASPTTQAPTTQAPTTSTVPFSSFKLICLATDQRYCITCKDTFEFDAETHEPDFKISLEVITENERQQFYQL